MIQIECHSTEELQTALKNFGYTVHEVVIIISRGTIYIEASDHEDQEYVPFIRSWEKKVYVGHPSKFDIKLLESYEFYESTNDLETFNPMEDETPTDDFCKDCIRNIKNLRMNDNLINHEWASPYEQKMFAAKCPVGKCKYDK